MFIREKRKEINMKRAELAEKLNVSLSQLSRLEKDNSLCRVGKLEKVIYALYGVEVDVINLVEEYLKCGKTIFELEDEIGELKFEIDKLKETQENQGYIETLYDHIHKLEDEVARLNSLNDTLRKDNYELKDDVLSIQNENRDIEENCKKLQEIINEKDKEMASIVKIMAKVGTLL